MLTLIIKPTHRCNLNCVYCYDRDNRQKDKSKMSLETVERLFELASQSTDTISIIWHGGEPFLMGAEWYRAVYEDILPKYYDLEKVNSSFQTNGTLFDMNILALCEKFNIDLGMSFDGELNDQTRNNTQTLMLNREKAKICGFENGWRGFLMVITPENAHTVLDSYRRSIREGYTMSFSEMFCTQSETDSIKALKTAVATYKELLEYILRHEASGTIPRPIDMYVTNILGVYTHSMCENMFCRSQWLGIHPDGALYPCGRDWPEELSYGNLHTMNSLKEIHDTKAYKDMLEGDNNTRQDCKDCDHYHICRGGCPNTRLLVTGSMAHKSKSHCYFVHAMHEAVLDVLLNIKHFEIENRMFLELFKQSRHKTYKEFREHIRKEWQKDEDTNQ